MPALPGLYEVILVVVIVVMLFGVGKLPDVFRQAGKAIGELRRGSADDDTE